ncbi:MAG: hypothetical protein V7731_18435 [Amphritea sp.]
MISEYEMIERQHSNQRMRQLVSYANLVWDAWVDSENTPVRACVESRLARSELLVEIQVVAAKA